MPLILPNVVANQIPADGANLEQNFTAIENYINTEVIQRDGSVGMTSPLLLPGPPTQPNQAASKAYVDAAGPVGSITHVRRGGRTDQLDVLPWSSRVTGHVRPLFAVIGVRYGAGDGSTTFNVPNFQATIPVGYNSTVNQPPGSAGQFAAGLGERAGSFNATLASHTHGGVDHFHPVNILSSGQTSNHYHGAQSDQGFVAKQSPGLPVIGYPTGGFETVLYTPNTDWASNDHAHAVNGSTGAADRSLTTAAAGSGDGTNGNIQPSMTVNFLIKAF